MESIMLIGWPANFATHTATAQGRPLGIGTDETPPRDSSRLNGRSVDECAVR